MMLGRNEIIAIINTVYDAVDRSRAGPICCETGSLNALGYNTFLGVVQKMLPTVIDGNIEGDFTERKLNGETVRATTSGNMEI